MEKILNINDEILLTIKRMGINGEGIGYYKRLAVFVDGAIPGEEVEVRITSIYDGYVKGILLKVKKASEYRILRPCPYEKCGGCQIQHMQYAFQLLQKQNIIIEAFNRYYDYDVNELDIRETIGMENPWAYRNKASLPIRIFDKKIVSGLYEQDSNRFVYIEDDLIHNKLIETVKKDILKILNKERVSIYNPKTRDGSLRYIIIRGFEETNEVQVTFVLKEEDKKLIEILKNLNVTSANYSLNADPKTIEMFGKDVVLVNGKKAIEGRLKNLKFLISPKAFFQLNTKQAVTLYDEIIKACKLTGKEKIVDCYCGIGSIGMMLAHNALEVRGIDINKEGIRDAMLFSNLNDIKNISFYTGNIIPHLEQFAEKGFTPDIAIVNPPRKGLDINFINYLKKSKIKKIVYVSCNPATLTKNLNHLQKEYIIRYVQPVDMFPQTANAECVVCLERR